MYQSVRQRYFNA